MLLEITTAIGCKNRCSYCPQEKLINAYSSSRNKNKDFLMSFAVFKKCIDKVPRDVDVGFVGFCEPFQNPECTKMILYANKRGHNVQLFTTLVGLAHPQLDLLLNKVSFSHFPFDKIKKGFQVHLPSEGNYERIKVNKKYLSLVQKLLNSKEIICFHYHGENVHPKLKKMLEKSEYHHAHQRPLHSRGRNIKIKKVKWPKKLRGEIICNFAIKKKGGFDLHCHVLLPDGTVVSCGNDYSLQHVLGNLSTSSWESLHKSKPYKEIKRGLKDESSNILCRYCFNTQNIDVKASWYNSELSLNKLFLGLKIFLYNKMNRPYFLLRLVKQFIVPGKKSEKGAEKWLEWT
jgi:hypothetical protein